MSGFHTKGLEACGVVVRAHATVPDEALTEARRRLERLLGQTAAIRDNLKRAGAELHVVGRDQAVTDLPMYHHLKGVPAVDGQTLDERARAYGGLHACVDEDSLLKLPSARHADHRDVCSHEVAHTVERYGLDADLRTAIRQRWKAATAEGRWVGAYAATNEHEFFAELTMWYVGSRGDHGTLPKPPADGPEGLRAYDPASFSLLDDLWTGRRAPTPVAWVRLRSGKALRSGHGDRETELVVENHTEHPLRLWWIDTGGRRVDYGLVPAGSLRAQPTYVTHAWLLSDETGREHGPFVAHREPGRVVIGA